MIPVGARHVVPHALELAGDADAAISDSLRFALSSWLGRSAISRPASSSREAAQGARAAEPARRAPALGTGHRAVTATTLAGWSETSTLSLGASLRQLPRPDPARALERHDPKARRDGKRGDRSALLLIHGAHAVLAAAPQVKQPDRLRTSAIELAARVGHDKATVALANKLARYAWAVAADRAFALTPAYA